MNIRSFGFCSFAEVNVPVYLVTTHAYRSWSEGNPRGYVQRGQGLQKTSERLARWRADNARQEPARFSADVRKVISQVVNEIAIERAVRLHAAGGNGDACACVDFVRESRMHMRGFEVLWEGLWGSQLCRGVRHAVEAENGAGDCEVQRDQWATMVFARVGFDADSRSRAF